MVTIRQERVADVPAREALLDLAFGPCRFEKTSQRLRDGHRPAEGLSFVATDFGRVVGTVRLWRVAAGEHPALLLGPLAVHPDFRACGAGGALVLLVGDAPYYARFGFSADRTGDLRMPGPYAADRLLAHELQPGALDGAHGLIFATHLPGERRRTPRLAPAAVHAVLPHAA